MLKVDMKWLKRTLPLSLFGAVAFLPLTTVQASDIPVNITDDLVELAQELSREQSFGDRASRNVYSPDSSGTARVPEIRTLEKASTAGALFSNKDLPVDESQLNFGYNGDLTAPTKLTPLNFGQFLIGQLTLAEYSGIWQNLGSENLPDRKCTLHYRDNSFVASGIQCVSYFNYVEAHSDDKGVLSSISIAGNQPAEQTTEEVLKILSDRYVPLSYNEMPTALKKVADLRMDLCKDLGALMDGNYKCEEHWFQFRNFYIVFAPSVYKNNHKEQFTYGTLHHFVDYESMMVKRRLAVVRQELSAKKAAKPQS